MHIIVNGMLRIGDGERTFGTLLLTESSLYALKSTNQDEILSGAQAGLIGVLLAHFKTRHEAQAALPAHFDELEIAQLDDKDRQTLLMTELVAKLPLNRGLSVQDTRLGFVFTVDGHPSVAYDGALRKRKVRRFLQDSGIQPRP